MLMDANRLAEANEFFVTLHSPQDAEEVVNVIDRAGQGSDLRQAIGMCRTVTINTQVSGK